METEIITSAKLGCFSKGVNGAETLIVSEEQLYQELLQHLQMGELKILTLGAKGRTLRGWSSLWNRLEPCFGGHFDTSQGKLFEFALYTVTDPQVLERSLSRAIQSIGRVAVNKDSGVSDFFFVHKIFAKFIYEDGGCWGIDSPLTIFVPTTGR